jgi:transposase
MSTRLRLFLACVVPGPPSRSLRARDGEDVDTLVERCAGLDIGKADLKACIRSPAGRGRRQEIRTFVTTTPGLLELRDWLGANEITVVGMEATGAYWKPVYYLLEDAFECNC